VEIIGDCYTAAKYKTSLIYLNDFIKEFNKWISAEIETQHFSNNMLIRIDKWLLIENPYNKTKEHVIGFKHNNINYYHEYITKERALKLSKAQFEQLLYHPDEVNRLCEKHCAPVEDPRIKNITKNIYDYYLYELLLIEYTELFNKEKNITLRHKIKKEIIDKVDVDSLVVINNITGIVNNYFDTYPTEPETEKLNDIYLLTTQINNYVIKHHDKKILFSQIDASFFNFDRIQINHLKTRTADQVYSELLKISKRVVNIMTEAEIKKMLNHKEEFPNMLISCQEKSTKSNIYCKQSKLIITQKKLTEFLEIMTSDILNPFKQKWMFNVLFTEKIVNYFKFIRRANESIFIELH
jgi:hypothetical protein